MEERIEKVNTGEQEKTEELKQAREDFKKWAEEEIEESETSEASQLKLIKDNQKKIPDEDFKLFIMHRTKEEDFDWEDFEPLEEKILKDLQDRDKDNNTRRVFYKFFSRKLKPRIIRAESERQKASENN